MRIYDDASQYYFITSKTYRNAAILNDTKINMVVLQCIQYQVREKFINLYAWVIVPDHIHILVEVIGKKNISQVMHDLKSYAAHKISPLILQRRQGFHALSGNAESRSVEASAAGRKYVKIWQTSFHDHIIRDQRDLHNHIDYIHYNPVKHNYVSKPEDWPWSSYGAYLKKGYYEPSWGCETIKVQGL